MPLTELTGGLPTYQGPLNPCITGRFQSDTHTIDRGIFESLASDVRGQPLKLYTNLELQVTQSGNVDGEPGTRRRASAPLISAEP